MKTGKSIGAIILMVLLLTPMACSDMPIETAISQQSLDMAEEKAEIEAIIQKSNIKRFLLENKDAFNRESLSNIE
ncbi:MAG TPA: hypothetical protein PKW25_06485 [Syntrophomonadaceae bacterium]|nr:hypothetical protein [Syntrophomonadaceae bacterium]